MTKPMVRIHNAQTNEIIDREFNAEELAQLQAEKIAAQSLANAEAQKAADKAAILSKLGITEDEARLLLG